MPCVHWSELRALHIGIEDICQICHVSIRGAIVFSSAAAVRSASALFGVLWHCILLMQPRHLHGHVVVWLFASSRRSRFRLQMYIVRLLQISLDFKLVHYSIQVFLWSCGFRFCMFLEAIVFAFVCVCCCVWCSIALGMSCCVLTIDVRNRVYAWKLLGIHCFPRAVHSNSCGCVRFCACYLDWCCSLCSLVLPNVAVVVRLGLLRVVWHRRCSGRVYRGSLSVHVALCVYSSLGGCIASIWSAGCIVLVHSSRSETISATVFFSGGCQFVNHLCCVSVSFASVC